MAATRQRHLELDLKHTAFMAVLSNNQPVLSYQLEGEPSVLAATLLGGAFQRDVATSSLPRGLELTQDYGVVKDPD